MPHAADDPRVQAAVMDRIAVLDHTNHPPVQTGKPCSLSVRDDVAELKRQIAALTDGMGFDRCMAFR